MAHLKPTVARKPYILVLSGPAGSGKSTVATILWRELPDRPAYLDVDGLKNLIWEAPSDDAHLDLASRNALSLACNFLDCNRSVIIDKAFGCYSFVAPFVEEGNRRKLPVFYFKFTAPLDVLIQRNRDRRRYTPEELLQQARWRRFCAPDENVVRIFRFCQEHRHKQGTEIDTSQVALPTVVETVRRRIIASLYGICDEAGG